MKKMLIVTAALLIFTSLAQAQDLKSVMKSMGTSLRMIAAQVTNPGQNNSTLALATDLLHNTKISREFNPAPTRQARYQEMIDQSITLTQELIAALQANDNVQAKLITDRLIQAKKTGHAEFN